ncbi:hypothetical protein [Phenylobacterium sp.]|uniref:hypothetical protein n=1 Tax=Phenylobacterium sp. TaxID=1871053 RepID=UPI002C4112C7|nr:hypothetical protein [Phenylobacterium sp.]HVI31039.1 hypothetical protein [Phenylobacterium sp.]
MKKASEYRQHARQCRTLAASLDGEARAQLLEMAATWDRMADDRARLVRNHPDLGLEGEAEEEGESPPDS